MEKGLHRKKQIFSTTNGFNSTACHTYCRRVIFIRHTAPETLFNARLPMLAVLDVLSNYEQDGDLVKYKTIEDRIVLLSERIIDATFSVWFKRKYEQKL